MLPTVTRLTALFTDIVKSTVLTRTGQTSTHRWRTWSCWMKTLTNDNGDWCFVDSSPMMSLDMPRSRPPSNNTISTDSLIYTSRFCSRLDSFRRTTWSNIHVAINVPIPLTTNADPTTLKLADCLHTQTTAQLQSYRHLQTSTDSFKPATPLIKKCSRPALQIIDKINKSRDWTERVQVTSKFQKLHKILLLHLSFNVLRIKMRKVRRLSYTIDELI